MDTQTADNTKNKIVANANERIAFLTRQIANLTLEYNGSVKVCQDEIDSLTLVTSSLQSFDTVAYSETLTTNAQKIG